MKNVAPPSHPPLTPINSLASLHMPRRRWLAWALAGASFAALATTRSWAVEPLSTENTASDKSNDPLWDLVLPTPDGGQLVLAEHAGKPLIVNFWATWCAPCVEELPLLNAFHAKDNGWATIGIAIDTPANVERFVQRFALAFPIGIAGTAGLRLSRELGNTSGLPYTLVVDKKGMIRDRKIGQITADDLANWELLA